MSSKGILKSNFEKKLSERKWKEDDKLQNTIESVRNYLQEDDLEKALSITKKFLTELVSIRHLFKDDSYIDERKSSLQIVFDEFNIDLECKSCGSNMDINIKDDIWLCSGLLCEDCKAAEQKKWIEKRHRNAMKSIGVPSRYLNARIEDFPDDYHHLTQTRAGVYLYGSCGVGKTHLMAALVRNDVMNAKPKKSIGYNPYRGFNDGPTYNYPIFGTVPELLYKLRSTYNNNFDSSENTIIESYTNSETLYLDDLGTEKASEWALEKLFFIIDRRYKNEKRILFSSNYSLSQLSNRLDDRIASRIAGMCDVIEMKGPDRRIQG